MVFRAFALAARKRSQMGLKPVARTVSSKKLPRFLTLAALIAAPFAISGCSFLDADSCANQANLPKEKLEANNCDGGFLSAKRLRETVYDGDDSPRIWTGSGPETTRTVNATSVNQPPAARQPVVGYLGPLRVEYPADEKAIRKDVSDIKLAGAVKFDPEEKFSVKFEKASLDYFLKQLLGGALGVNYVAPEDLGGSVTFKTEQPIPKGQLLQVVRDVLGRNGLEMRYMNGVYHIGTPDAMAALQKTTAAGRAGDQATRAVRLSKGGAAEIIGFVKQLLPEDVTLTASNGGDSIIIRAAPDDLDKIAELISISDNGITDDRVAIIPVRQTSPEKLAAQLTEFYRTQIGSGPDGITVIPLENQQALLVGTKDHRLMQGLRKLVAQLDRDTGGDMSLRIVPLVHLGAEEIVPQLTSIFGGGSGASPGRSKSPLSGQNAPSQGKSSGDSFSSPPPQSGTGDTSTSGGNTTGSSLTNVADISALSSEQGSALAQAGGAGPAVRFVADTRNNTVMIYSSYGMFKRVQELLKVLDVPQPQVVIEATVAEVDLNDDLQRGVEAFLTAKGVLDASSSATGGKPTFGTLQPGGYVHTQFGVDGAKVDLVIHALQAVTRVKTLSSPYLTVLDGKTARLVIGDQIPFSTTTQTANLNSGVTVTNQIQVQDTGVVLEVTPKIRADNTAILHIEQSVSEVSPTSNTGSLTPTISTRSVKSDVVAKSGTTILLGGLIKDGVNKTETGIPVARNIPYVGELFQQHEDHATRQELIVLITPRVIRHSMQLENITRQLRGQLHIR